MLRLRDFMVTKQTNAVVNATQDFAIGQRDATPAAGGDRTYNWQLEFYANAEQADKTARNFSVADNYVRRLGLEPTEQARIVYHLRRESWERERRLTSEADAVTIANMHIVAQERQGAYLEAEQRATAQAVIQEIQRAQEQAQQRGGGQQRHAQQQAAQERHYDAPEAPNVRKLYVTAALYENVLPFLDREVIKNLKIEKSRGKPKQSFRDWFFGDRIFGYYKITGLKEYTDYVKDAAANARYRIVEQAPAAPRQPVRPHRRGQPGALRPPLRRPPQGGQGGAPPAAPPAAPPVRPPVAPAPRPAPQAPRHANVPAPANPPAPGQGPAQPAQAAPTGYTLRTTSPAADAVKAARLSDRFLGFFYRQAGSAPPQTDFDYDSIDSTSRFYTADQMGNIERQLNSQPIAQLGEPFQQQAAMETIVLRQKIRNANKTVINKRYVPKPPTRLELAKSKLGLYNHVFKYNKNDDGTLTVGFRYDNAANGSDIYNRWILPALKGLGTIAKEKAVIEGQKFAAVTKVEHDKADEAYVMKVLEALKKDSEGRWITSRAAKLAVKRSADAKAVSKWFSYREPATEVEPLTFAERLAEDGISFVPPTSMQ